MEWWLEPRPNGGTTLRLRESGFTDDAALDANTFGWLDELGELQDHLATEPWQHPIRRKLELKAGRQRVWRALTDPSELAEWWGPLADLEIRPGSEGWFDFPEQGRHAVWIVAVDEPRYMAWRSTADQPDAALADVRQPLMVEWLLRARDDGGTDLHLMESGFSGPAEFADNNQGWDEILPLLAKLVD